MTELADPTSTNVYLEGNVAPVSEEVTAHDLPVKGSIPTDLEGRWLRNGANPFGEVADPAHHHWFLGHGMVHGVRLRGGRAEWYRNRWVRNNQITEALGEPAVTGPDFGTRDPSPNTSVGGFAGRTWAMVEAGGTPVELSYELDTIARNGFGDTLEGPFTAHPKYDRATGELHGMCYSWPDLLTPEGPVVHHVVVGPDGHVARTTPIPVPDMIMLHDMSLTERWVVVYDLPVTVNFDLSAQGYRFPFAWNPNHEPRVGLLPRNGSADDIVWCSVDPCYVFHPLNAHDAEDGTVVVDVCRYERMMEHDHLGPFGDTLPTLTRWTIDPAAGVVRESTISDRPQEFPTHDPRVGLTEHRWGYTASLAADPDHLHGPAYQTDLRTGEVNVHDFGPGRGGAEPLVVPKADSTTEEGVWVLSVVYDATKRSSELHVIDGEDFSGPAVAEISLPQRVPFGFHGAWVPDTSVPPPA